MVVAATGFFDGVHIGHAKVIEELIRTAKAEGKKSAVITFWPHPRNVLRQDAKNLRLLTSLDEKKELFHSMGVDEVHVINFTKAFSMLSAEEFIREYLIKQYNVSTLILGFDHRIGHKVDAKGVALETIAEQLGVKAIRVGAISNDYDTISSTHIRNFIESGGIERANVMLGYNYFISGVITGDMPNRDGSKTIIMTPYNPLKLIPENGDYNVIINIEDERIRAICKIDNGEIQIHTQAFSEETFGLDINVEFLSKK